MKKIAALLFSLIIILGFANIAEARRNCNPHGVSNNYNYNRSSGDVISKRQETYQNNYTNPYNYSPYYQSQQASRNYYPVRNNLVEQKRFVRIYY